MRITICMLALASLTWMGCGQDAGQPLGAEAGSDVAARAPESGGAELTADAQSCLGLVSDRRYAEAIDPCTRAARELPDDERVAAALAQAKREAANDARGAAASAAAEQLGR